MKAKLGYNLFGDENHGVDQRACLKNANDCFCHPIWSVNTLGWIGRFGLHNTIAKSSTGLRSSENNDNKEVNAVICRNAMIYL